MSSEMREIKAMADAVEYGIALGKLDAPAVFTKMRDLLNLALLARTEAGAVCRYCGDSGKVVNVAGAVVGVCAEHGDSAPVADGAVAEVRECAELVWLNGGVCQLSPGTKLYTHPQDASGYAEPRFKPLDRVVWTSKLGTEFRGAIRHINEPQPLSYWIDLDDGTSVQRAIGSDIAMQAKEAK